MDLPQGFKRLNPQSNHTTKKNNKKLGWQNKCQRLVFKYEKDKIKIFKLHISIDSHIIWSSKNSIIFNYKIQVFNWTE